MAFLELESSWGDQKTALRSESEAFLLDSLGKFKAGVLIFLHHFYKIPFYHPNPV